MPYYSLDVRSVAAQPIAIVRGPTTVANLVGTIRSLFDKFYASSKDKPGLNIVFYPDWNCAGEFEIECGVQVEGGGNSATPAGTVATTVYLGSYNQMKPAHEAAGPSWEVYGHWSDDPAKLRTDIFYLLA